MVQAPVKTNYGECNVSLTLGLPRSCVINIFTVVIGMAVRYANGFVIVTPLRRR
jgi:hypothetical protein